MEEPEDDVYLENMDDDELGVVLSNEVSPLSTPMSSSTPIQSPSCLPRRQTPSSQNSAEPSEASEQQSSGTYFFSDISYRVATFACNHLGYRDEDTFGIVKKGKYYSASDFNFTLAAEVICSNPSSSGYLINLTPVGSNDTRLLIVEVYL